ncbi:4Fe-4S binding protein [Carboxylicivirga mesophila]|uniref:4Fe-4S binding protein n=2 Tax=Carboxylicivirga TaxID=1628153 RepID=A0A941F081_9BACT|nr:MULTISPECIES: [Fe-Fe] hydrogenase large subunit C-terminal domain-containing protein [Carboxylicivirga]MBR8534142.1 4Fe-4S binding protein [Carboxylicivirga sediminis]MBS2212070.1 4Fe-4S binding protein [Carboxylicivirga mesophila]
MSEQQFYHALKVDKDLCFGCTHCMNVCPTDAIRIRDGIASIRKNWCVDCGECMKSCPVDAFYVEQDDFEKIFNFKYRVAVLPSVFIGQFSKQIKECEIIDVLKGLGFTHVVPAEATVDVINESMLDELKSDRDKPMISAFCPSIVRLIQVRFPGLVNNIIPIKPPIDTTAMYYRELLQEEGKSADEIGVFYVTPCASKIATVKSPVGDDMSNVDGVINMDFLYNKVYHVLKTRSNTQFSCEETVPYLSPKGLNWSLTDGEASQMTGRCLAIDEIHNVISFLEKVENDEIINVDFLELRACDQSCAGGVLLTENRFLTVERLKNRAERINASGKYVQNISDAHRQLIKNNNYVGRVEPRSMMVLDEDMSIALKKMERVRRMMCYLPGIDCGACGAPNCESLAKDIVRKEANLSNCVFLQRMMEKSKKLDPQHSIRIIEKTWGKDRLDKDCKKKGAKDEANM